MLKKVLRIIGILSLILFSCFLIGLGIYLNTLTKPEKYMGYSIDKIDNFYKTYIFDFDSIFDKETFTIESNINLDLESEYYLRNSILDEESKKKNNLIKNLSNMNTNILIKQNKKQKQAFLALNEKIGEEEILNTKLLINNSTQYYFLNGLSNQYINDGGNNYFETINKEITTKDNYNYIHNFIIASLKRNLKEEYFQMKIVNENIQGKNQEVNQISIKITDKTIRDILNNVLKDLKKDKKSFEILSRMDKNFKKYKFNQEDISFSKNEYYQLNIYTTKYLYKPLKYELTYMNENDKKTYIYEDYDNSGIYYYLENDSVLYQSNIKFKRNSISATIEGKTERKVGDFKIERDNKDILLNYSFDNGEKKVDINYSSKYQNDSKNSSINNIELIFKVVENKESKLSGRVTMNNLKYNNAKIEEDTSHAILKSGLSDEQQNFTKNTKERIRERLEKE